MNIQSLPTPSNTLHELAKVYCDSYASPHHMTFSLDGLLRLFEEFNTRARTAEKIVSDTEGIAAIMAKHFEGSVLQEGHNYRTATNPKAIKCWDVAVKIQEVLTGTDVVDSVSALDEQVDEPTLFRVGDVVASNNNLYFLRSGAGFYASAVVVQEAPIILVSFGADMRWKSTVQADKLVWMGRATPAELKKCMTRLDK